jgi:hypothetical protein
MCQKQEGKGGGGECVPALVAFPLPLFTLLALVVRALVTVAGVGAARGGNSSREIFVTEAGEDTRAVGVTSRESMGAGVASLSHPSALAVWLGAGELILS